VRLLQTQQISFDALPGRLGVGPWPPLGSESRGAPLRSPSVIPSVPHSVLPARYLGSAAKPTPPAPTPTCSVRRTASLEVERHHPGTTLAPERFTAVIDACRPRHLRRWPPRGSDLRDGQPPELPSPGKVGKVWHSTVSPPGLPHASPGGERPHDPACKIVADHAESEIVWTLYGHKTHPDNPR
jgi:hypothetical protein